MTTIRSYTTIEQSRKLAEILPLESADMVYICIDMGRKWINVPRFIEDVPDHTDDYDICAWSLASLLGILSFPCIEQNYKGKWICRVEHENTTYLWEDSNPVDACYEMIIRLHELKKL